MKVTILAPLVATTIAANWARSSARESVKLFVFTWGARSSTEQVEQASFKANITSFSDFNDSLAAVTTITKGSPSCEGAPLTKKSAAVIIHSPAKAFP